MESQVPPSHSGASYRGPIPQPYSRSPPTGSAQLGVGNATWGILLEVIQEDCLTSGYVGTNTPNIFLLILIVKAIGEFGLESFILHKLATVNYASTLTRLLCMHFFIYVYSSSKVILKKFSWHISRQLCQNGSTLKCIKVIWTNAAHFSVLTWH